jgi:hypothetical protein
MARIFFTVRRCNGEDWGYYDIQIIYCDKHDEGIFCISPKKLKGTTKHPGMFFVICDFISEAGDNRFPKYKIDIGEGQVLCYLYYHSNTRLKYSLFTSIIRDNNNTTTTITTNKQHKVLNLSFGYTHRKQWQRRPRTHPHEGVHHYFDDHRHRLLLITEEILVVLQQQQLLPRWRWYYSL